MKNYVCLFFFAFVSSYVCAQEFKVGLEARDKRTKKNLPAIISVKATNSERELIGQMRDDLYVVNVLPNVEYQVIVAYQDYNTFRQTLNFEKTGSSTETQPFLVNLISFKDVPFVDKSAVIIEQPAPVAEKPVVIVQKPTVIIETKISEKIVPTVAKIEKPVEVIEKPAAAIIKNEVKQNLAFRAIDAMTGQPVAAKFKLTDNIKDTYSGTTNNDDNFYDVTVLVQPEPYQLLVTAGGYRNYQEKIALIKTLSNDQAKKTIKLSKSDVFIKINVLDEQTVAALQTATIRVIDVADKRAAVNVRDAPNGQAVAQIQPERKYTVEVEAAGYVPFSKPLDEVLTKLNTQNTLNVKLKKFTESYIAISAINAITGQRVPAKFKLKGEQSNEIIEISTTAGALVAKMKVTDPDIYHVETIAVGFKTSTSNLDAEEIIPGQDLNFEAKLTPGPGGMASTTLTKPLPVTVSFNFLVVDASTNNAIPNAKFRVINQRTKQPINSIKAISNGFQVGLVADDFYIVEVEANGYDKSQLKFEAASGGRSEFQISLNVAKKIAPIARRGPKPVVNERIFDNIKIGQSVAIEDNVYFDQSSYVLRYEAYPQLARLAAIMLRNPKMTVGIIGHTDNVGDPRLNLILSENRSKVISNFLANKGVPENRILHTGEGQTRPLANNETEENRKRNRRVEFIIK
jgi:outer membrane protein OmpA-like peptidoglycan-associated protein/transcriptional regulator of met regulon